MNFQKRREARIKKLQACCGDRIEKIKATRIARREEYAYKLLDNLKTGRKVSAGFTRPREFQEAVKFWKDLGWLVVEPLHGSKCKLHERVFCKHVACVFKW